MNCVIKFICLLLFIGHSLTENNVKIKDVLRNSSKYNDKNKTNENNSDQNQNDDIFRREMLKNFRQCVSNGNGDNDYDENDGGGKHKNMKNLQYKRNNESGNFYGMKKLTFHRFFSVFISYSCFYRYLFAVYNVCSSVII